MRVKKFAALMLALLFAVTLVPAAGSAADMEYEVNYGEYFAIYLWEGYDNLDNVIVESGSLPPGIHVIKEYNNTTGNYDFYAAGSPTALGTYYANMEICPNGVMHSYFSIQITVITPVKIKTKTLPQATVGVYYQSMIETNYPYTEVDFVEVWNPGVGVVLPYLGLTLTNNGTIYGTPKRAGTYYIYVGVGVKSNSSYDEAMVKLVIKEGDDPGPTEPPAPGGVVPKCFMDADSIIYYEPGTHYDELLFHMITDETVPGSLYGLVPDYLDLYYDKDMDYVRLTGDFPNKIEGDGVIEFDIPLQTGGSVVYVHFVLAPMKNVGYPHANELPTGF